MFFDSRLCLLTDLFGIKINILNIKYCKIKKGIKALPALKRRII